MCGCTRRRASRLWSMSTQKPVSMAVVPSLSRSSYAGGQESNRESSAQCRSLSSGRRRGFSVCNLFVLLSGDPSAWAAALRFAPPLVRDTQLPERWLLSHANIDSQDGLPSATVGLRDSGEVGVYLCELDDGRRGTGETVADAIRAALESEGLGDV